MVLGEDASKSYIISEWGMLAVLVAMWNSERVQQALEQTPFTERL
jgi:hypothetical protein